MLAFSWEGIIYPLNANDSHLPCCQPLDPGRGHCCPQELGSVTKLRGWGLCSGHDISPVSRFPFIPVSCAEVLQPLGLLHLFGALGHCPPSYLPSDLLELDPCSGEDKVVPVAPTVLSIPPLSGHFPRALLPSSSEAASHHVSFPDSLPYWSTH